MARDRGFLGGVWRVRDEENFEWFYVRPHQSGNPDATQYTPVFNGCSGWQLYHGEPYAVAVQLPFDEWFRVRIRFQAGAAAIEVAGEQLAPVPLKRAPAGGAVGVGVGGPVAGHFSNFAYSTEVGEPIAAPPPPEAMPGAITSWSVSDVFSEEAARRRRPPRRAHLDAARVRAGRAGRPRTCEPPRRAREDGARAGDHRLAPRADQEARVRLQRPRARLPRTAGRCTGEPTPTARATTASSAASAGSTPSTCRSRRDRTSSSSPSPRTSASAGGSRRGSTAWTA